MKTKSNFNPPDGRNETLDDVITLLRNNQQPVKKANIFNISKTERQAMTELGKNKNLVIKEADNRSAVIIMNADYYVEKIHQIIMDGSSYARMLSNDEIKVDEHYHKLCYEPWQ